MAIDLITPIQEDAARGLSIGDEVRISGTMVTARDAAHKFMIETFVRQKTGISAEDAALEESLKEALQGGVIYHCGPIVAKDDGSWRFVSAGPTTSIREEPYQADVIDHFEVRGIIGKGGMGARTREGLGKTGAVYLHAIGGAGALCARSVKKVKAVHKLEFGLPEAFWVVEVESFPAVVTMDSHGGSLHDEISERSKDALEKILGG